MWTEHTEYDEYHKLQLSPFVRYQHNNTLGKISSNYRYRQNPQKYRDIICFQYRTPLRPTNIYRNTMKFKWAQTQIPTTHNLYERSNLQLGQKQATSDINLI